MYLSVIIDENSVVNTLKKGDVLMAKMLNISDRLAGSLELENYSVKRYNDQNSLDILLFQKERDLEPVGDLTYCNTNDLKELEDYILENVRKLKVDPKEFSDKLYTHKNNMSPMIQYSEMVRYIKCNLNKKTLTRKQLFEGIMRIADNDYVDFLYQGLTTEEYFLYIYNIYKQLKGIKTYFTYYVTKNNENKENYVPFDFEKVNKEPVNYKKYGILTNSVNIITDRLDTLNAISESDAYIVMNKKKDETHILFGRHELYNYLCEVNSVGLKNFKYYWLKMAEETGVENKKGKNFIIGNSYISKLSYEPYVFSGYSSDGQLVFTSRNSKYSVQFLADDFFDDVEYRIYNLEHNLKQLKEQVTDLDVRIETVNNRITMIMSAYMSGKLEEYKRTMVEVHKDVIAYSKKMSNNAGEINQNYKIKQAIKQAPSDYKFIGFDGNKAVFTNVKGVYQNEQILGDKKILIEIE